MSHWLLAPDHIILMKRIPSLPRAAILAMGVIAMASAQMPGEPLVLVPLGQVPRDIPLFFSATAEVAARISLDEITTRQALAITIHQGEPKVVSLDLGGPGEVVRVEGDGLRDWSVRVAADGARFLDLRPLIRDGVPVPKELRVTMTTRHQGWAQQAEVLLAGPGEATGFALTAEVAAAPGVDLRLAAAEGLVAVEGLAAGRKFVGTGKAALGFHAAAAGSDARGIEWLDAALAGRVAPDGSSVAFRLSAAARSAGEGSAVELFSGGAALAGGLVGDGWHVVLRKRPGDAAHELAAERAGDLRVEVDLVAPVTRRGDWQVVDFHLPAGVAVPLTLEGLDAGATFDRAQAVVPRPDAAGGVWRGFLPADGRVVLAWRAGDEVADGTLFFSGMETTEMRVGSGLLRQASLLEMRVLQGKLEALTLRMEGTGEVLAVVGDDVVGWSVREADDGRFLDVKLGRPAESAVVLRVEAQAALAAMPVRVGPLRFSPVGALRHSGWLRVANEGAVKVEVEDPEGLVQMPARQFPGTADESLRQVLVYRFPAEARSYVIAADRIVPELSVNEVTVYELAETDRRIVADIELDIREAPLREFEVDIPADHAVAAATGAAVADYALGGAAGDGMTRLKIMFHEAVIGRQLIHLTLEKNQAAAAGPWVPVPLGFPEAKSRRGYVGAVAAAGYRLAVATSPGLVEAPVSFFPKQRPGLQLAFRIRDGDWSAALEVEALGRSVQADVFHLYSLKAGAAYGSVLINYFVIGAPSNEWRIRMPAGLGNIEVTGQGVGRDWRMEEEVLVVPLSRPVLGPGTLLLSFEQPMNARGGSLAPGSVRPLEVQGERGYVQVVSPLHVNYEISSSSGALLSLDASELPAEFRLLSSAPTLAAWQYTSPDFEIGMNVEWFETGETVGQLVDFLSLSSRLSKDGQWVTDAKMFVKSRQSQALRMALPPGVSLWNASVNGEPVNARTDGLETLVPISATDPREAVEVTLRYGASAGHPTRAGLAAPRLACPVVLGEWTVTGDDGRELVHRGGSANFVSGELPESAAAWLSRHVAWAMALFGLAVASMIAAGRAAEGWRGVIALGCGLAVVAGAMALGVAASGAAVAGGPLVFSAPALAAGEALTVDIANLPRWRARTGWLVWLPMVAGLCLFGAGWWFDRKWLRPAGFALVAAGLLAVRGGGGLFFAVFAAVTSVCLLPQAVVLAKTWRRPKVVPAAATAMVIGLIGVLAAAPAVAGTAAAAAAESMVHHWEIRDGRLHGSLEVTVRADPGDRFLLLVPPAVLGEFAGDGLRVVKGPHGGGDAYFLLADAGGRLSGRAEFEMPLADPENGWALPSGPAAMRRVTVALDKPGWEFASAAAARVEVPDGTAETSRATILLGPAEVVTISARPRQRDAGSEEARFFSEVANLYLPGAGLAGGRHRVMVRPAQGRVSTVRLQVPQGWVVSEVAEGPVAQWRFDPAAGELRVALDAAREQAFGFTVETQQSTGRLPVDLTFAPLRVTGTAGEVGTLAIAFADDTRLVSAEAAGLSRTNVEDLWRALLPAEATAVVQQAYRYGAAEAALVIRVDEVEPELRAEWTEMVSIGDDRLVVALGLAVDIKRAGLFRLAVDLPDELEIESVTGGSLSHWSESTAAGTRTLTLHLAGKLLGGHEFQITLAGQSPGALAGWQVPRVSLRGAARESGLVVVVPERGLQVRAVGRRNVSQADRRTFTGEAAGAAARPGALAFRLLSGDWDLSLAIDRLDPWVTARVFHEVTLREGQVLETVALDYRIENAAVKVLPIRIPGLDAEAAGTVRATGTAVAGIVPLVGAEGSWEIRFERAMAGSAEVKIEYQRRRDDAAATLLEPVVPEEIRQVSYFAAVRAGGRLEIEAGTLPRGWERTDWAVAQATLGRSAAGGAPLLVFRVSDPDGPLPLVLKRHELAGTRKVRVSQARLTSLLAPTGQVLTAVDLRLDLNDKGTLRMMLPEGAGLVHLFVNDEGATLVREAEAWLFHVAPSPDPSKPASVRFVFSSAAGKNPRLEGPVLDVPMENLSWRILVPEGWELASHQGDFDLAGRQVDAGFGLAEYRSLAAGKRRDDTLGAVALLDQANEWLRSGDQERAGQALANATRTNRLDEASNEDARIQLMQLKTQQAVLGVNTRRQRMAFDNRLDTGAVGNPQLERAVLANPLMQGEANYDPREFDRFMEGNSADENAALKEIASRIVAQQLAADPAPAGIDLQLPERGTILDFSRSVQVEGRRPMAIQLQLRRTNDTSVWLALLGCAVFAGLAIPRRWGMSR